MVVVILGHRLLQSSCMLSSRVDDPKSYTTVFARSLHACSITGLFLNATMMLAGCDLSGALTPLSPAPFCTFCCNLLTLEPQVLEDLMANAELSLDAALSSIKAVFTILSGEGELTHSLRP